MILRMRGRILLFRARRLVLESDGGVVAQERDGGVGRRQATRVTPAL